MRICFFISSLGMGGAERQACLLSNEWTLAGHEVILLCASVTKSAYPLNETVRVESFRKCAPAGRLLQHCTDFRDMRSAVRKHRPDVVLSFIDVMNLKVIAAIAPLGVPVIVSERVVPSAVFRREGGLISGIAIAALRRLLYPRASVLVVQSAQVAEWANKYRVCKDVRVIPNLMQATKNVDSPNKLPMILTVGRLTYQKGHDLLIRAFASIAADIPEWRVRIVGDGPLKGELQALASGLGVANRVEFPGQTAAPEIEYASASLFVLPSRFEGFPNVLLEAMYYGCPILASDCPGASPEILGHGRDGVLFQSEDIADLARKLKALILDSMLRKQMGERAEASVSRFRPSEVLPLWESFLGAGAGKSENVLP